MATQTQQTAQHTGAWLTFNYALVLRLDRMVGARHPVCAGRYLDQSLLRDGARSCWCNPAITITKTVRDVHEGAKFVNRIEDARTERLLMEIERGKE